jgi:hypothetical protein
LRSPPARFLPESVQPFRKRRDHLPAPAETV